MKNTELLTMELHDVITISGENPLVKFGIEPPEEEYIVMEIMRVYGGWIYNHLELNTSTFVPEN